MTMTGNKLVLPAIVFALVLSGCAGIGANSGAKKPAPDFSVKLMDGTTATLARFKGKPLVLNIGATWCPLCRHELPAFKDVHKKYDGEIGLVMVFSNSEKADVEALVKEYSLEFMVGHDLDLSVKDAYGVKGIPATFFIDAQGRIVDDYLGSMSESGLTRRIDRMLGR